MTTDEILLKETQGYIGYQLQSIAKTTFDPVETGAVPMQRIPAKVSRFIDRSKISEVFKCDCFKDPLDAYYVVRSTDGTLFHLEY